MKHSKRFSELVTKFDRLTEYELEEAVGKIKELSNTKFDETVEISVNLGVDPRHADQMIRSTVSLPHGVGKVVRVLVLCKEDKVQEALDAGADFAGLEEYIEKIQGGWFDIDSIIASPDVMPMVGKIGRTLGPRGLMPNPKTGTVTPNVGEAVQEIKAGRLSFRTDRYGIIHLPVGKASFEATKLYENILMIIRTLQSLRPPSSKGLYFKKIHLSSSMGPGIKVNKTSALAALRV